jgi:CMP-N-acetylneuraminic acid synthetase
MLLDKKVLAIVPARSGSKGVPDKNISELDGVSLIGHAGRCLAELEWLDAAVISTDSERYAEEGRKYQLDAPFLRPADLASDQASAVDTALHALEASEKYYGTRFDVLLIVEPTSPMRKSDDIYQVTKLLVETAADSVVAVSPLSSKYHPLKVLTLEGGYLMNYEAAGQSIVARQQLSKLYIRNGVCYAVTRDCLLRERKLFTSNTRPYVIERELVNIDDPIDFAWAEFLIEMEKRRTEYPDLPER